MQYKGLVDSINGCFQGLPILFELLGILALLRHKKVRGFSLMSTSFFSLWSLWNLFYYQNLGQVWSVTGSFWTGAAGICYTFMAFYYVHLEQNKKPENKKIIVLGSITAILVNRGVGTILVFAGAMYIGAHKWTDTLNSVFEFGAAFFVLRNCLTLIKDKEFKGASTLGVIFYTSWGAWNVFYYYYIEQYFSWFAGLLIFAANCWYVYLIFYYVFKTKRLTSPSSA